MGDDNQKLKVKLMDLEAINQQNAMKIKDLQKEVNEYSQYKQGYDYMKEQTLKVQSEFHLQNLEIEKAVGLARDAESQKH